MSIKTFFASMTLKMKVILICAAVAVAGGTAAALGIILTKEETYRVLKVFELTGNAIVERSGSGELEAYVGMNLESGDILTVGGDSTIRISMDNDKYVLLDSGTVLELIATGTPSDSRTSLNLKNGTILNEITTPLSANSSYEVSTPKATMAVRGTSYMVSVKKTSNGRYIIRENTFQGNVEAELIDSNGNRTGKTALVPPDKGVTICTEPDENSGNPAEVDGTSRFVTEDMNGNISDLADDKDPLHDIQYNLISKSIKDNALRSNDENLMLLEKNVLFKLRGEMPESSVTSVTTVPTETETTTVTTTVTTVPTEIETTKTTTVTTVPTKTETTKTTTVTTVPTKTETTTKAITVTTAPKKEKAPKKTTTVTTVPTKTETTTKTTTVTTVPPSTGTGPITSVPTVTTTVTTVPPKTETTTTTTVPTETETTTTTTVPTETEATTTTTVPTETEATTTTTVPTETEATTTTPAAGQGVITVIDINGNILSADAYSAGDGFIIPDTNENVMWVLTNEDGEDFGSYNSGDWVTYDLNFGTTLTLQAISN